MGLQLPFVGFAGRQSGQVQPIVCVTPSQSVHVDEHDVALAAVLTKVIASPNARKRVRPLKFFMKNLLWVRVPQIIVPKRSMHRKNSAWRLYKIFS